MNRDDLVPHSAISEARLTAYAVDELNEIERAEVRRELARSRELESEVEAIQSVAARLQLEFARASADAAESDLGRWPAAGKPPGRIRWLRNKPLAAVAIAASMVAALGWQIWHGTGMPVRAGQDAANRVSGESLADARGSAPSLWYDLPAAARQQLFASQPLNLAYDNPRHGANLDDSLLNFTVRYQRDF